MAARNEEDRVGVVSWLLRKLALGLLWLVKTWWVTLVWLAAIGFVLSIAHPLVRVVALVLMVAVAVALWFIPRCRGFVPGWGDFQRWRYRRQEDQARIQGHHYSVALGLVDAIPEHLRAWAFSKPQKRLPGGLVRHTADGVTLRAWQKLPATSEAILAKAQAFAPTIGMIPELTTVERTAQSTVLLVKWYKAEPVDLLATGRGGHFAVNAAGAPILGRVQDGSNFALDVVGDPFHVITQGASRSGKSVAVYSLLGGYAAAAAAGEVVICGCDPTGILLAPFAEYPGAEFRALGLSDLDAIPAALNALVAEMDRRIADLLMGQGRDKLDKGDAPALLVVLEEYPGLLSALESADKALKSDQRRLPAVKNAVQRLIQEGAKALVRVQILAQRADASIVGGSERSNVGSRISLRVDNSDAVRMLHADASPEMVERIRSFKPGYAYVERAGLPPEVVRFDMADYAAYRAHVLEMQRRIDSGRE